MYLLARRHTVETAYMYEIVERMLSRVWLGDLALRPTGANFVRIAEAIGLQDDYIPFPVQEVIGSGALVQRLAIAWEEGVWRLLVRDNSIDLEYRQPSARPAISFEQFLQEAGRVFSAAADHFARPAFRMAGVQEGILRELTADQMQAVARRLLVLTPSFQTAEVFEWDWRVVAKVERQFGTKRERGNTIASLKRLAGVFNETTPFDRLRLSTDINTDVQNTQPRFQPEDIRNFFNASTQWHDAVVRETMELAGVPQ